MKKVCMVVPNPMVKGGIAAVVNGYRGSQLEKDYSIIYVESYIDGGKLTKLLKGINGYFHFIRVLLMDKPDIVHIHSSFGPSFYRKIPFIYMASWARKPIINHIHGADFDAFYTNATDRKKRLIKKIYDKCNVLIALSDEWKYNLSQIVSSEKIVVIENYSLLHEDAVLEKVQRTSNNTVLFLGEIGRRKGCYDIPEVIAKVAKKIPNVKIILAGAGSKVDENNIKLLLNKMNVEQNAQLSGWVRKKEKDLILRQADVFFLPSYNEGMPMSILEAMGYGLPIVSTTVGGICKIVENKVNGYTLNPGDIHGMAEALISILSNDEYRKTLGKQSFCIVKNKYSLKTHLDKIRKQYERELTK